MARPAGQPAEEDERGHDREAERHDHERRPEARPVRERRQVAVEEAAERELECVLGPDQEREDSDLDRADHARQGEQVEDPLERVRHRPGKHDESEGEPADQQREADEVEPAQDVLGRRRPGGAVGVRGRRGGDADPEREDAGDDVPVPGQRLPTDGVGAGRQGATLATIACPPLSA